MAFISKDVKVSQACNFCHHRGGESEDQRAGQEESLTRGEPDRQGHCEWHKKSEEVRMKESRRRKTDKNSFYRSTMRKNSVICNVSVVYLLFLNSVSKF